MGIGATKPQGPDGRSSAVRGPETRPIYRLNGWSVLAVLLAVLSLLPRSILFRTPEWRAAPSLRRDALLRLLSDIDMKVTVRNLGWLILVFSLTFTTLYAVGSLFEAGFDVAKFATFVLLMQIFCKSTSTAYLRCLHGQLRRTPRWQAHDREVLNEAHASDLGPLVYRFDAAAKRAVPRAVGCSVVLWVVFAAILSATYLIGAEDAVFSMGVLVLAICFVGLTIATVLPALQPTVYSLYRDGYVIEKGGVPSVCVPFSHIAAIRRGETANYKVVYLKDGRTLVIEGWSSLDESLEDPAFSISSAYTAWRNQAHA